MIGQATAVTRLAGERLAALLRGHADTTEGVRGGVVPHRLPAWARVQTDDPLFGMAERCPAGVALRFTTRATRVALTLATTTVEIEGRGEPAPGAVAIVTPGHRARVVPVPVGDVVRLSPALVPVGRDVREPVRVELDLSDRAAASAPVEVWLPHDRSCELISLEADAPIESAPIDGRFRWTHYGSSISHGIEAPSAAHTWPAQVALANDWRLRHLGFSGNAALDPFAARMIAAESADLITLKVGINLVVGDLMRRRTMLPLLHGFLDTIRERQPETPVVLITAIACPIHEDSPGPTVTRDGTATAAARSVELDDGALTLAETRRIVGRVVADRADPRLHLIDGRDLFGPQDAPLLYDGLHPTAEGLSLIARRFPAALAAVVPASALR